MNGFDDFDTKVTAEEFYDGWTEDEADYYREKAEDQQVEPYPHDLDGFEYPEFDG